MLRRIIGEDIELVVSARPDLAPVFLIEDDEAVRTVARRVLRRYGYTVVEAVDGDDGLRLLERLGGKVDLIVTDLVMPKMSGRELADQLRRRGSAPAPDSSCHPEPAAHENQEC